MPQDFFDNVIYH